MINFHVPFWVTTVIILVMILLYTFEGGVKTIVCTDTLQTTLHAGWACYLCNFYFNNMGFSFGDSLASDERQRATVKYF